MTKQFATPPHIGFGSRVTKSPYFEATRRAGCNAFTVYNHTYMPIWYEDPLKEYEHLVNGVTIWDVACERQVEVTGPDAYEFVRLLTPRDLSKCAVGQCKYVMLTTETGGIVNDPVMLRLGENHFWFSLADSDVRLWMMGLAYNSGMNVRFDEPDVSPLQIQGPHSTQVVKALFGDWIEEIKYFWFRETELNGIPLVLSRTGWSNERGYELFLRDGSRGNELWDLVMEAGKPYDITPACPSQIKRMEAGLLSYHNDMNLTNNPYEVGYGKFCKLDQDADFMAKAALKRIKEEGITQKLVGVEIEGDPIPVNEHHWPASREGEPAGHLTSAVYSPRLDKNIAYVMTPIAHAENGTELSITMPGDEDRKATVCPVPFMANEAL
jgi:aminomethyltransferase